MTDMSRSCVLVLARARTLNGTVTIARALKAAAERSAERHLPILYVALHEQLVRQCEVRVSLSKNIFALFARSERPTSTVQLRRVCVRMRRPPLPHRR